MKCNLIFPVLLNSLKSSRLGKVIKAELSVNIVSTLHFTSLSQCFESRNKIKINKLKTNISIFIFFPHDAFLLNARIQAMLDSVQNTVITFSSTLS